ncbi:hypothetical protein BZA70DRAFT_31999 [Myxozyma melibiosi]|uniref:Uncharacterized protein n=1 Tax=Myxozyma melibiosi TaxID=54550 RepID=A0ABR1FFR5_9ASCO
MQVDVGCYIYCVVFPFPFHFLYISFHAVGVDFLHHICGVVTKNGEAQVLFFFILSLLFISLVYLFLQYVWLFISFFIVGLLRSFVVAGCRLVLLMFMNAFFYRRYSLCYFRLGLFIYVSVVGIYHFVL